MADHLHRFWFRFAPGSRLPPGVVMGCGVTAFSLEDALALMQERVFGRRPMPAPAAQVADVDIATLDEGHVRPNVGVPVVRGVWFPLGYDAPVDRER